jgi:hypothetical protein
MCDHGARIVEAGHERAKPGRLARRIVSVDETQLRPQAEDQNDARREPLSLARRPASMVLIAPVAIDVSSEPRGVDSTGARNA